MKFKNLHSCESVCLKDKVAFKIGLEDKTSKFFGKRVRPKLCKKTCV